jgi:hypothetical protein
MDFGLYLSVVYLIAFHDLIVPQLWQVWPIVMGGPYVFHQSPRILSLYKVAHHFGNVQVT